MSRVEIKSTAEFDEFLKNHGENLSVVYFWASWAVQCQQMSDIVDELAKDSRLFTVKFLAVEAEKLPVLCQKYSIDSVPAFIFIRNGKEIDRLSGANGPELNRKIRYLVDNYVPDASIAKKDLDSRLRDLISYDKVMLFMKGTPAEPRCGFSRQIVAILNEHSAKYGTFDILSDTDVREGLKKLSNWPTYPQLYINGELVGGLDIVKELQASGELDQMLVKTESLEDRLRQLTHKQPVMLFMKGNPDVPKCGFSRQIIQILNDTKVHYGTFDILEDQDVREGLKKFSNWPTYPQLYVKGQLIGGLDIVKELVNSGELESTLKAA
ncbi:glutaredoxin-3-like [Paramacrobiotus metropolitanus]|uniref:glutaredoxin-3-like n=1 Tax=Paramacrobiotus metropolitanus TaxID=2943436 RepID=UPI002446479E|nr:glutaredoxin-3-like [Paramacrobiotus metropolitanus]